MLLLATVIAVRAVAQTQAPPSFQASANATVSVAPDEARIQIGVISQASNAAAAASQNAAQLQKALDQLKAAAGPKAEVKTISYTLTPNYDTGKNGARAIKGFTANNMVLVITSDLTSVGKIIDAAMQSGANEVQSMQFTLKDPAQARREALRKAALQARADAESVASALGLRLGRVLRIDENAGLPPQPIMMMAAEERIAPATPIQQPQTIDVSATVTLTIALEQQ